MVYQDGISSFEELLQKDGSVKIHHRNFQFLATEMYKVTKGIGPAFMKEIFAKTQMHLLRTHMHTLVLNPSSIIQLITRK